MNTTSAINLDGATLLAEQRADCPPTAALYWRIWRLAGGRQVAEICLGADPEWVAIPGGDDPEELIQWGIWQWITDTQSHLGAAQAIELAAQWGIVEAAEPGDPECYVLGITQWYGGYNTYRVIEGGPLDHSEAERLKAELEAEQLRPYGCPVLAHGQAASECYLLVRPL